MAQKVKGITIEIGGDSTGLQNALKKADTQIKKTQKELKSIEAALKLDPGNVDLLAARQRKLAESVKQTKEAYEAVAKARQKAEEQLKNGEITQAQFDEVNKELVFRENAYRKAELAARSYNVALKDLGSSAAYVAEQTKALSIAGAAVIGGLATAAVKTGQWADELLTLSQQTGLTTDELQKMEYASELVDVSVDSMTGAMAKLTRNMTDTGGAASQAFDRLGVSVLGADGQMRSSSDVFYATLEALSRVRNETERDQLAMQLFGRSANELAGIIDDGGAALRAYGDEAERNGSIIDNALVQSMGEFNDKIDAFKAQAVPQLLQAGGNAIEALTPLLESFIGIVSGLLEVIGSLDPTLIQVIATMAMFAASIHPISLGVRELAKTILFFTAGGLTEMINVLGTAGGKMTAIVALLGLLAMLVMQVANAWGDMSGWEKAISVMGALVIAATAAAIALGAVQSAASMGIAAAAIVAGIIAITAAVNSATKRKAESNQRVMPMMASGGELWRGSAIVGEAGPELLTMDNGHAVVQPLTTNNYNTTTNNYGSSRPQIIQVTLDKQVLAEGLYDPMQELEKAHGPNWTR